MNSLNAFTPNAFTPPKVPPQDDVSAAPEGVDPAALIVARKAAVDRNRRQAARASLLQDVLRIIGVAVLIAGIAWFARMRHQQHLEAQRQKAELERAELVAIEKERQAEAARQDARRKAEREARQAAEEVQRRRQEEKQRVADQKAEAMRVKKANIERYQAALARFKGAGLGLLATAPASDLPAKVANETWFSCIMPGGRTGLILYEILAVPGQNFRVLRLEEEGKIEDVPFEDFNRQAAKSPYLLSKGSYCYFNPANGRRWELQRPVLAEGETLDPSREDFRDLYNIVRRLGLVTSSFTYNVFFRDYGGGETRLMAVPFGGTVTRNAVQRELQAAEGPQRQQNSAALHARMKQGSLIIRRGGATR